MRVFFFGGGETSIQQISLLGEEFILRTFKLFFIMFMAPVSSIPIE
jgi:hypothetical protein